MAKRPEDKDDKPEKDSITDKVYKSYGDYDNHNWAGQQTDKGADVRREGSDR